MGAVIILFTVFQLNVFEIIVTRIENGHGILITIIGVVGVFSGLVLLWFIFLAFPYISSFLQGQPLKKEKPASEKLEQGSGKEKETFNEIAAAIGVALCYELEDEDISILTLRHLEQEMSPWVVASRPSTMRHS